MRLIYAIFDLEFYVTQKKYMFREDGVFHENFKNFRLSMLFLGV